MSGTMTEVAFHLRHWLRRHDIDPDAVEVEIRCKDHRTQARIEMAHQIERRENGEITMPVRDGIATMPPYTATIYGMKFKWTNPDRWDVRGRSL